jgi:FMN reductase
VSTPTDSAGHRPFIVGIGGTTRPGSTSESALIAALAAAERGGARTELFGGEILSQLPIYRPENQERTEAEQALVAAVRAADGVIVSTPGYHGGVSGLVKNALDLLEDTNKDERPYFEGRGVGSIVTAYGWQACGTTLMSLRSIVHALRGWPTPYGATLNTSAKLFDANGLPADEKTAGQLATVGEQVLAFTRMHASLR